MQIGLHIGPLSRFHPMAEWLHFVQCAERLGFDPLLFSDTVSLSRFHVFDPFVLNGLVAGATRHAALGTCVTTPVTRHVSVLANAFATLAHAIAPRQAILGIGSGDTAAYLIGKRHVRLAVLREFVEVLRGLLDGVAVDYEGRTLESNWGHHHVPIFLAADGPKTLALGGEKANGVILGAGILPEVIQWARERIGEGEARAGKDAGSTNLWVDTIVSVGEEREAVRRTLRGRVANRANHNFRVAYNMVPDAHQAEVRRFREQYTEGDVGEHSANTENVTDDLIDRFAVAGTRSDVIERFEQLAEMGRGPLSNERLSIDGDGLVVHELKRPFRDGTTQCLFEPLDFLARLAALVPRPRAHLIRYHGVFAPNARHRAVVLAKLRSRSTGADDEPKAHASGAAMTWMQRLRRVYDIDVTICPVCGGALKVLAVITEPTVIASILGHVARRTARAPPVAA